MKGFSRTWLAFNRCLIATLVILAVVVGLPLTPNASAQNALPITAGVEVTSDNVVAGAHPNLTIKMVKPPNRCLDGAIDCEKPYLEQDLKRWVIRLPEGLMADPQAAPQCVDPQKGPETQWQYLCPASTKIGELTGKTRNCKPGLCPDEDNFPLKGAIYMGKPKAGEQARLHALIGTSDAEGNFSQWVRADTSVTVSQEPSGKLAIDAVTDNVPDYMELPGGAIIPLQPYELSMTLWGNVGAGDGHPLLTNATFCKPRNLESTFQGYSGYSFQGNDGKVHLGSGAGSTVTDSAPYSIYGCNSLAYNPSFSFGLSDLTAGAAPAIDTNITQTQAEQTNSSVSVRIPGDFRINTFNKVVPCSKVQMAANSCSPSSRIGTAKAHSPLLPTGYISGEVFIGEAGPASFPLRVRLTGFVDLSIDGTVSMSSDGSVDARFSNLPPVPLSSFTMHLDGGKERGLLLNPARCGDQSVTTTLRSHQGREVRRSVPMHISCGDASFWAGLSPRRPKAYPTISLSARTTGIERLSFDLPRQLKVRKGSRLLVGKSYGEVSLMTSRGSKEAKLLLLSGSSRKLSFVVSEYGTALATATLRVSKRKLRASRKRGRSRKRRKPIRRHRRSIRRHPASTAKRKGGRRSHGRRRHSRKRRARTVNKRLLLSFHDLPSDLKGVALELSGRAGKFLRNPSSCRSKLSFSAEIVNPEGTIQKPTREVKLKCKKKRKKSSRKKKRERRK